MRSHARPASCITCRPSALGSDAKTNDGLRRAWFFACKDEAINPRKPSRLPLLFALDAKLGVAGGLVYSPRAAAAAAERHRTAAPRRSATAADFGDASFSGDAGAMGGARRQRWRLAGGDGGGGGCGGD